MKYPLIRVTFNRFLFLFILGFILTLPQRYSIFPDFGEIFKPLSEGLGRLVVNQPDGHFYSDSPVMLGWIIALVGIALIGSITWSVVKRKPHPLFHFWFYRLVTYYLIFVLLTYGFNKIFKYQFFFPEPNTLFTPVGQLTPDILYWSSMGTSYSYSMFAGLIEVIPAFLLLFRKTRLLGALIALGVLINVAMINFGFDITVKIFSLFLIGLCLFIIYPHFGQLYDFFVRERLVKPAEKKLFPKSKRYQKIYPILKPLVVGLILFEVLIPYFQTGYFNGDTAPKTNCFGAYTVMGDQGIKRVFIHSKSYLITESESTVFEDHMLRQNGENLNLYHPTYGNEYLTLTQQNDTLFRLQGYFMNKGIDWILIKIDLEKLPVKSGEFGINSRH